MSQEEELRKFTGDVISWFNQAYYFNREQTWFQTYWRGVHVYKATTDLWTYQQILHQTRPTLIIETGTAEGGAALYLADLGDIMGGIRIVSIDINNEKMRAKLPVHDAITYLAGSSIDPQLFVQVKSHVRPDDRVMIILDSDHSATHVRAELELYAPLATPGCYLIVEDTNVNGHPVYPRHGPGPMEAVQDFLTTHSEFEPDRSREQFMLTFNPQGYLRRR